MDRSGAVGWSERSVAGRGPREAYVLPSRREAADALHAALDAQAGPAVVTGEPGVGKTWLCRLLRDSSPAPWRWIRVDLSPAVGPGELYHLLTHGMGLAPSGGPAEARAAMADALEAAAADGERWGMIVEECHAAGTAVLEELRVVTNRLGEPDALAGVIFTGQTPLARRLVTGPLAALGARVAACVHVRPFTVEEAGAWLAEFDPQRDWNDLDVERLHRATRGNPRRIAFHSTSQPVQSPALRVRKSVPRREQVAFAGSESTPGPPQCEETTDHAQSPLILPPGKPPLRVGDGMIEVGWDANPDPDEVLEGDPGAMSTSGPAPSSMTTEEAVNDHYAALQAWSEWAQNQGREPVASVEGSEVAEAEDDDAEAEDTDDDGAVSEHPGLRAEGQHAFAPYSQLFSRLRQPRDSG